MRVLFFLQLQTRITDINYPLVITFLSFVWIDKFKSNVFFVTVSKKPNLYLIVQELYHRTGAQVPDFQNDVTAVSWLQQFLKQTGQNPMLVILDDVWAGSEFILEKFDELKMLNYKILVTSRFTFPRFGSPYHLECLNYEDAMALFHHSASLEDRSFYIPEDLPRKVIFSVCNAKHICLLMQERMKRYYIPFIC